MKLVITIDVDVDPRYEDPHEVAEALFDDYDNETGDRLRWPKLPPYCGNAVKFVSAEWADK